MTGPFLCGDLQVITDVVLVVWDKAEENNEDWNHCKGANRCILFTVIWKIYAVKIFLYLPTTTKINHTKAFQHT